MEALPYIRSYRGQTVVVKIGGAALDDSGMADLVAGDLALLGLVGIRIVLVHGGGPQVTQAMNEAGLTPRFVGGLRVTDDASMEIVRRVLIGSINSDLVARLCSAGLQAVGLSGIDGGLIEAEPAAGDRGQDLGRVGRVVRVRPKLLVGLLDQGYTPVVTSVAASASRFFLNVNADEVAGAVASSLQATKFVLLTNVEGLYADLGDSGSLISELTLEELRGLGDGLSAGMRPKAAAIAAALQAGVRKAHIIDGRIDHALLLEIFTDEGIGTQVLP